MTTNTTKHLDKDLIAVSDDTTIDSKIEELQQNYLNIIGLLKNSDSDEYINSLLDYGKFLDRFARYQEAMKVYEKLLPALIKRDGENAIITGLVTNYLGSVYDSLDKYDNALECFNKLWLHLRNNMARSMKR